MLFVTSPAFNSSMPLLFGSVFNFNPHLMQLDVSFYSHVLYARP